MTDTPGAKTNENAGCLGLVALVVVIGILASLGKCSSDDTNTATAANASAAQVAATLSNAVAAQGPPPVQPISHKSVRKGAAHFRLAYGAEGLPGAMIYSQNCYDALSKSFTWEKLDVCGGFDAAAAAAITDEDTASFSKEASFFDPEMAAQRYLAAATGAGESAENADQRLSTMQNSLPKPRPKATELPTQPSVEILVDQNSAEAATDAPGNAIN